MRYLFVATIFMQGCSFQFGLSKDQEQKLEKVEAMSRKEKHVLSCDEKCEPYKAKYIIVNDGRCICEIK